MGVGRPDGGDPGPGPTAADQLWRLGARPDSLLGSAATWRDLARGAEVAGADVGTSASVLLTGWAGDSAQAYRTHQTGLVKAFLAVSAVASSIAGAIDDAAGVVRMVQHQLDDAWRRQDVDEALDIRAHADGRLAALASELDGARGRLWPPATVLAASGEAASWLGTPWSGGPAGSSEGFVELAAAGQVFVDGDRVVVNATGGDDDIRVSVDPRSGEQVITMGAVVRRFPAGAEVIVRAGGGNDTITVAPGLTVRVCLLAGSGDDRVHGGDGDDTVLGLWGRDTVWAGGGADQVCGGADGDYLDGQGGNDRLDGGAGEDTLYGLDGDDVLWGGSDRDYVDGGAGADMVAGGGAADVLLGGREGDTVLGGSGDDALYSGAGIDRIHGGSGDDRAFTQIDDAVSGVGTEVRVELTDVGGFIRVEGSPEFVARVQSDLDALRSSPRGAAMLAALESSHTDSGLFRTSNGLVIREIDAANGFARPPFLGLGHATIGYNPAFDDLHLSPPVPPTVVLYHELAHVYDYFHDTLAAGTYEGADNPGVPNAEREAVGLPIDHDGDPDTPDTLDPDHPFELTENGLRDEFGLTPRLRY